MTTFTLFAVALAAALAVALALRGHADLEHVFKDLSGLTAKLAVHEADLSTLRRRVSAVHDDPWSGERASSERSPPAPAAAQADPRVYVQLVPDQPHDRVILSNRTDVVARDVVLRLEGRGGISPFLPEFQDRNFPVDELQQGVPYIVLASFREGWGSEAEARLEWRDPDGTPQVREFPLRW
jgi:hypothetical protein